MLTYEKMKAPEKVKYLFPVEGASWKIRGPESSEIPLEFIKAYSEMLPGKNIALFYQFSTGDWRVCTNAYDKTRDFVVLEFDKSGTINARPTTLIKEMVQYEDIFDTVGIMYENNKGYWSIIPPADNNSVDEDVLVGMRVSA